MLIRALVSSNVSMENFTKAHTYKLAGGYTQLGYHASCDGTMMTVPPAATAKQVQG